MKIGIVTDSMSDLPRNLAHHYGIVIVPGIIYINDQCYQSGVNFFTNDIEKYLDDDIEIKTGAPPPYEYYKIYKSLINRFDTVISIHCPSEHSAVLNSAKAAARRLDDPSHVKHFVCGVATLGLGLTSIAAAIIANEIKDLDELFTQVEIFCRKIRVIGTVNSLKYVKRSGRLKLKIAGLFANALSIKPVLSMQNAKISVIAKPRNRELAIDLMVNELINQIDQKTNPRIIGIGHFKSNIDSQEVENKIKTLLPEYLIIRSHVDPMIAAYTGPGLILIAFFSS